MTLTVATSWNGIVAARTLDGVLRKIGANRRSFEINKSHAEKNAPSVFVMGKKKEKVTMWWVWENVKLAEAKDEIDERIFGISKN
jgi:hypothetical protein